MATIEFEREEIIEKNLIDTLIHGVSQWTYEPELKTETALWNNFRRILEANNKDVLKDKPLTESEFKQIKAQLDFPSFYDAAKFLVGENGIAKVTVQREDASLGIIRLSVFKRQDVAGGTSVYQVINQFQADKRRTMDQDSRFDVSLLFNGLPLIHIELKNRSKPFKDAYHQIDRYLETGKFRGIFSCVQVFVISNASETRYFAATTRSKLNPKFLIRWVDEENNPVDNLYDFASEVLSIPEAHKLISFYTVLDDDAENIIVLRPYQIHAIKAVQRAASNGESGYIWHTTGSGKTLTSYKASRNLYQIKSIDKTVFIVDRTDLDQQTTSSFMSYAQNDTIEIDETDNVATLIKNLLSGDRNVVITTVQKLNYLLKNQDSRLKETEINRLRNLNIAFVVDECHRAISAEQQDKIKKFFRHSRWYGFTGTPIFAENQKNSPGNLARTTEEQFGRRLHEYTVKEAIGDKAVLGFQVENRSTIRDDDLFEIVKKAGKDPYNMEDIDIEHNIHEAYFNEEDHMLAVIDEIVNKSVNKFNLDADRGKSYGAILTTSSISHAQKYYELFKKVKNGESRVKISDRVRSKLSDFPRVAITYSISENQEMTVENKARLAEAIADYNEEFGTGYTLETVNGYNRNLNDRLARKKEIYKNRAEQVDIVIVVDRLLTGFDSPSLGILFIDRAPMTPQGLIQAFSRTNRLFDERKQFGQVVTFRTPNIFSESIEDAFRLYSNGGENFVIAPLYDEVRRIYIEAVNRLKDIAPTPEATGDFKTDEEKIEYIRAFQAYDRAVASLVVYGDFEEDSGVKDYIIEPKEVEEYNARYENIKEELSDDEIQIPDLLDINYEPISVKSQRIDFYYLSGLLQEKAKRAGDFPESHEKELIRSIEVIKNENPKMGDIYEEIYEEIKSRPEEFRNMDINRYIDDKFNKITEDKIDEIVEKFKLKKSDVIFYTQHFKSGSEGKNIGEDTMVKSSDLEGYRESQPDSEKPISRLSYIRKIRKEVKEFVEEEIMPYYVR